MKQTSVTERVWKLQANLTKTAIKYKKLSVLMSFVIEDRFWISDTNYQSYNRILYNLLFKRSWYGNHRREKNPTAIYITKHIYFQIIRYKNRFKMDDRIEWWGWPEGFRLHLAWNRKTVVINQGIQPNMRNLWTTTSACLTLYREAKDRFCPCFQLLEDKKTINKN